MSVTATHQSVSSDSARGASTHRQWPVPDRSWFLRMNWHDLLFMHWPVDPDAIQKSLPEGVKVDLFEGQAWIGIVPFRMSGVAPRFVPNLPWLSAFPELNVRTYVTVNGKPGVWFYSLDATNPIAVRGARKLFHLKYMDAKIQMKKQESWIRYVSKRTHKGEPAAELDIEYRPLGSAYRSKPNSLEHFLTARYCLYVTTPRGNVLRGEIDHDPWELVDAQAIIHTNTMLNGLGIQLPDSEPLLHFSRTTRVVAWANESVK